MTLRRIHTNIIIMRTGRPRKPLIERFASRLQLDYETGCWNWIDPNTAGYGVIADENRISKLSHRVSYELFVGDIEDGEEIHHQCQNTRCCNPYHLKALSRHGHRSAHAELLTECINGHQYVEGSFVLDRGARRCLLCRRERERAATIEWRKTNPPKPHPNTGKEQCKRGHDFTEANTYHTKAGSRQCRECMKMLKKRWLESRPQKVPRGTPKPFCKHNHAMTTENTYTYRGRRSCRICIADRHTKSKAKTLIEPVRSADLETDSKTDPTV